ncbi:putative reverse transcriptase domain-containing protein, partial [Tanacetum coccineum]
MTLVAIEEIITQRVTEALAAQEANRAARLEAESQSQNEDEGNHNKFQELTLLCPRMVPEEAEKIERTRESWTTTQRENRAQPPLFKRQIVGGQNVVRVYMAGSNEKHGYDRSSPYCNKCKLQCTVKCNNYKKVGHMARDCKAAVPTLAPRALMPNQRVVNCFGCGGQGQYNSDCPKMKCQNHENKSGNAEARGRAYLIGGGDTKLDLTLSW